MGKLDEKEVADTLHLLGYSAYRYGQYPRAEAYFGLLTTLEPMKAAAWIGLAASQEALGENEKAKSSAEKALNLADGPGEKRAAFWILACAAHREGKQQEAQGYATKYLELRRAAGQAS